MILWSPSCSSRSSLPSCTPPVMSRFCLLIRTSPGSSDSCCARCWSRQQRVKTEVLHAHLRWSSRASKRARCRELSHSSSWAFIAVSRDALSSVGTLSCCCANCWVCTCARNLIFCLSGNSFSCNCNKVVDHLLLKGLFLSFCFGRKLIAIWRTRRARMHMLRLLITSSRMSTACKILSSVTFLGKNAWDSLVFYAICLLLMYESFLWLISQSVCDNCL